MGWAAQLFSGEIVRERDSAGWNDVNIHLVGRLWIEGFEEYALSRNILRNFVEFIQFKTACVGSEGKAVVESRCIGWTDGNKEFLIRICERTGEVSPEIVGRIHFHPMSCYVSPNGDFTKE